MGRISTATPPTNVANGITTAPTTTSPPVISFNDGIRLSSWDTYYGPNITTTLEMRMTTLPPTYLAQLADIQQSIKTQLTVAQALATETLATETTRLTLWLQTPPCAPDPRTLNAPDHWRHRALQEYWQEAMDWALHFKGPRRGPWTSEYRWSYAEKETYTGWKFTIDNARNHALNREDNVTVEYHLQLIEAVEEAIWAEEIRLQDDASDAKWHDELLCRTTTSYELCFQDYVTWFANYKRRKATEQ